jgi:ParB family transcriptional regulator, chromosome partitioning protein
VVTTSYRTYEPHFTLPLAALPPTEQNLDANKVAALAKLMLQVGTVMSPIYVNAAADGYRIRDGRHRVAAARAAGFDAVPVRVMSD